MTIEELLDSKKFNAHMRLISMRWTKRKYQHEKVEMIQTMLDMIGVQKVQEENWNPVSTHTPRHDVSRKPEAGPIVLNDRSELPPDYDPFKQLEPDVSKPLVEPNLVTRRKQMTQMLADTISKLPPHNVGQTIIFPMPMDWNITEAPIFFEALGTHALAPGRNGSFGSQMLADKSGWEISAIRMR